MNKDIIKHFEDQLTDLEDRCIHKVEDYYNDYLVGFLCDFKEVTGPFGEDDLYYFWLENAIDINRVINNIIAEKEIDQNLLLRAVKIKRIADSHLLRINKEIDLSLYLETEIDKGKIPPIPLNHKITNRKQFIKNLFDVLTDRRFIDCEFEKFNRHFFESSLLTPINWIRQINLLAALIKFMRNGGLIDRNAKLPNLILNHFTVNNESLSKRSLEVTLSKVQDDDKNIQEIKDIVSSLKINSS